MMLGIYPLDLAGIEPHQTSCAVFPWRKARLPLQQMDASRLATSMELARDQIKLLARAIKRLH
jgi:hypothetical protein